MSQTRRLLKVCRPSVTVVASENHVDTRTMIESGQQFGFENVCILDGIGRGSNGYSVLGSNYPNMINAVPGMAHRNLFGQSLPENQQPRCVNIPNPLTLQVYHLRGKYPGPSRRRVLMISYGPDHSFSSARVPFMDDYTLSILAAARKLPEQGIGVTLPLTTAKNNSIIIILWKKPGRPI